MNILQLQQEEGLGEQTSHRFSIEEETEELINEVFNQKYQPVYNPASTKHREQLYTRNKRIVNYQHRAKDLNPRNLTPKIYQNVQEEEASPSFKEFLLRAQERIDKRNHWLTLQRQKKQQSERRTLKEIPDILRGSREKVQPIYQRCITLHTSKEKQLEKKRIEKYKKQIEQAESHTYHPIVNVPSHKIRTFQEYFAQKEIWREQKEQQLEKKRVACEVKKLSECTFTPNLVAKYNKPNPRIVPGEKVEQRLLRSIERSLQKDKENT